MILQKYKNHPSITCINNLIVNSELTFKLSQKLRSASKYDKKVGWLTDIPTKLLKEFRDFFSEFIYKSIKHCKVL